VPVSIAPTAERIAEVRALPCRVRWPDTGGYTDTTIGRAVDWGAGIDPALIAKHKLTPEEVAAIRVARVAVQSPAPRPPTTVYYPLAAYSLQYCPT